MNAVTEARRQLPAVVDQREFLTATDRVATFVAALLLAALTCYGARIFNVTFGPLQRICLLLQLGVFLWSVTVAISRGHVGVAVAGVSTVTYVLFSHGLFCYISGGRPDFNAMAAFLPVVAFVFFSESRVRMETIGRILAWISVFYAALYVGTHDLLIHMNTDAVGGVLAADGSRAQRLFLAAAWPAYAAFYFALDRKFPTPVRIVCVAIAMAAMLISGSRGFTAMFIIIFALQLAGLTGMMLRVAIFSSFLIALAALLTGLLFTQWNPYALMASDSSASYRASEFLRAIHAIHSYWPLGIGLPDQPQALSHFLRTARYEVIYPSDLGPLGILLMLGVPGLMLCVALVYFCTIGSASRASSVAVRAVQSTCLLMAAIAWLSPMLMIEPASVFVGILIGIFVRSRRHEKARDRARALHQPHTLLKLSMSGSKST